MSGQEQRENACHGRCDHTSSDQTERDPRLLRDENALHEGVEPSQSGAVPEGTPDHRGCREERHGSPQDVQDDHELQHVAQGIGGMRILTVRQPWAWAIIHGGKDVENRVRNIAGSYRGPVAIHVAQEVGSYNDVEAALQAVHLVTGQDVRTMVVGRPRYGGRIIGVVDLVDVHHATSDDLGAIRCDINPPGQPWAHECSPWADEVSTHLVLANPRPLSTPIPYRGALGLRRFDEATIARIQEAIA